MSRMVRALDGPKGDPGMDNLKEELEQLREQLHVLSRLVERLQVQQRVLETWKKVHAALHENGGHNG